MILVDTSVWADHLGKGDRRLAGLLEEGLVLMHPFVLGEISLGNLRPRETILNSLATLPTVRVADDSEVMGLIERTQLFGTGIGWVDAHLIASASLNATRLWTRDKRLAEAARKLDLLFEPS